MKVVAIHCPSCDDVIWSRHRHDFRYCKCGKYWIDGGRDYVRSNTPNTHILEIPEGKKNVRKSK